MLLQRLCELERRDAETGTPSMYKPTRVQWVLHLSKEGELEGVVPLTGKGKGGEKGQELLAPYLVRTVAIKPLLLCDKADYALGIPKEDDEEKARERHRQFVALTERCAEATKHPAVKAVATFVRSRRFGSRQGLKGVEPGHVVTFEVRGTRPIDLPEVRAFWSKTMRGAPGDANLMACLVCSERKPVERRLQIKIKGIPGGQTSGTSLISANQEAFRSYGLGESYVSPICRGCAEASHKALNRLLAGEKTRLRIGDALVWIFWARKGDGAGSVLDYLDEPKPEDVRSLLQSPWKGKSAAGAVDASDFFAVALSASGGRAVVRDYVETSTDDVRRNLERWFTLQRLEGTDTDPPAYGVRVFCRSLTHDLNKEMQPSVPQTLVRSALTGAPLPDSLLHLVARRTRAEQRLTRPRAMLAKMVLVSNPKFGYSKEDLIQMDPDNHEPAYLCGRLFAELEAAQYAALGDTNTTIRDRYFGTASTAPKIVFPSLLRGTQNHLGKLRKEKRGAFVAIDARIEGIVAALPAGFPATLDLGRQGLFYVGYYHQRAANRAAVRERSAEKEKEGDDSDA